MKASQKNTECKCVCVEKERKTSQSVYLTGIKVWTEKIKLNRMQTAATKYTPDKIDKNAINNSNVCFASNKYINAFRGGEQNKKKKKPNERRLRCN